MEPASVIGILTFGLHVSRRLYRLYDTAAGAGDDVASLCGSAKALTSILHLIQGTLENARNSEALIDIVRHNIAGCEAGLARLDKKLRKIQRLSSEPAVLNLPLRLRYAFQAKTLAKLNAIIHGDLLGNLRLALAALNLNLSVETWTAIETAEAQARDGFRTLRSDLEDGLGAVNEGVGNLTRAMESFRLGDQRNKIIQWVAANDMVGGFHQSVCDQRQPGTGDWFLQGDTYQRWKASAASFLWLHGIPGSGKTVLCSSIINDAVSYCSLRVNHHLAFFYFSFSDEARQSTDACIRSVLRQLLLQRDTLPARVVDIWKKSGHTQPALDTWREMLHAVVEGNRETFVLVDALDECPSLSGERERLLKFLRSLVEMHLPSLHILVTSRKVSDVERVLGQLGHFGPFGIRNAEVDRDIVKYVEVEIGQDSVMQQWPAGLRHEVERELGSRANGMFRWVSCQLAELRKCLRPSVVRKTLAVLPATLDETYNHMLVSIAPQYREEAARALKWLICSKKPLTIDELAEAVVINLEEEGEVDISERLFDANSITNVLSGLIAVSHNIVRLAHFSVAEYLTSDRLVGTDVSDFWVSVPDCTPKLLRACLRYLQTDAIQTESFGSPPNYAPPLQYRPPLLNHAANCWVEYARGCPANQPFCTVSMITFFLRCEAASRLWKAGWEDRSIRTARQHRRFLSYHPSDPLYFSAFFGLEGVLLAVLQTDTLDLDTQRSHNLTEALQEASYQSHNSIVRILLEAGANADEKTLEVAMDAVAAGRPSPDIVLQLLNKTARLSRSHLTARLLRWSIRERQYPIVDTVLARLEGGIGADLAWYRRPMSRPWWYEPEAPSYNYRGSPCFDAVLGGDIRIVQLFLSGWENIDECDEEGRTALYWAVFYGNVEVVGLLLHHGANPDIELPAWGWSPIYWAIEKNFESILAMLGQAMEWRY